LGISGSEQYMITNGGAIIEDMNGKIKHQLKCQLPWSEHHLA